MNLPNGTFISVVIRDTTNVHKRLAADKSTPTVAKIPCDCELSAMYWTKQWLRNEKALPKRANRMQLRTFKRWMRNTKRYGVHFVPVKLFTMPY